MLDLRESRFAFRPLHKERPYSFTRRAARCRQRPRFRGRAHHPSNRCCSYMEEHQIDPQDVKAYCSFVLAQCGGAPARPRHPQERSHMKMPASSSRLCETPWKRVGTDPAWRSGMRSRTWLSGEGQQPVSPRCDRVDRIHPPQHPPQADAAGAGGITSTSQPAMPAACSSRRPARPSSTTSMRPR